MSWYIFLPLVTVVLIVFLGVPIWFAMRAKPLADLPYRWGTFCAAAMATPAAVFSMIVVAGLLLHLVTGKLNAEFIEKATLVLLVCLWNLYGAKCLFNRMRAGAVVLMVNHLFVFFEASHVGKMGSPDAYRIILFGLVSLVANLAYFFKRRWKYMASGLWPKTGTGRAVIMS